MSPAMFPESAGIDDAIDDGDITRVVDPEPARPDPTVPPHPARPAHGISAWLQHVHQKRHRASVLSSLRASVS